MDSIEKNIICGDIENVSIEQAKAEDNSLDTCENQLRRWKTAFNTDNLAHAIVERETGISILNDLVKGLNDINTLKNRAAEFLKNI